MKKKGLLIAAGSVVLVIVLIVAGLVSSYNGLVTKQEAVKKADSDIQTVMQRRADLIPGLIESVKKYAAHEEGVYTALADARAKLSSASNPAEYDDAVNTLNSATTQLLAIAENYPELKAADTFISFNDELSGTENRIAVARKDYNDTATEYNTAIKKFPTVIIANMFGFKEAPLFRAADEAATAPTVSFD